MSEAQNELLRDAMNAYMAEKDINRGELAAELGITGASLSNFLNRKGGASPATALRACRLFGIDIEDFVHAMPVARAAVTTDLDGQVDPTIAKVGKAIGADTRDIAAASSVRSAWGTAGLTEARAKELIEGMARMRREDERASQLAALEAAAGVKVAPKVRGPQVADPDDFGPPKLVPVKRQK